MKCIHAKMTFIHMKSFIYEHIHPYKWSKLTLRFKLQAQALHSCTNHLLILLTSSLQIHMIIWQCKDNLCWTLNAPITMYLLKNNHIILVWNKSAHSMGKSFHDNYSLNDDNTSYSRSKISWMCWTTHLSRLKITKVAPSCQPWPYDKVT